MSNIGYSSIQPTLTYKVDHQAGRILRQIDGVEAVLQAVDKIFKTDKYAYVIYDEFYGNELNTLMGKPLSVAQTQMPRLVQEALLTDDRITAISNYVVFAIGLSTLVAEFTVHTIYGDLKYTTGEISYAG